MFENICGKLNLGKYVNHEQLSGGITNEVYKLTTNISTYIVKIINSDNIKNNNNLLNKIELSEYIAELAQKNGVNSVPALKYNNKYIQKIDNKYILIYNYLEGKVLLTKEITLDNVKQLAIQLAKLHSIKINKYANAIKYEKNNYSKYYNLLENNNEQWAIFYKNNYKKLQEIYENVYKNYLNLSNQQSYIHKDYNRKNVLWQNNIPNIIDWETATIGNPSIDFFNSAWFLTADVNIDKYTTFCKEYFNIFELQDDINVSAHASIIEECNWLEYSLKRALAINSKNEKEIEIGKKSIIPSLTEIINYYEKIPLMIEIIDKVKKEIL